MAKESSWDLLESLFFAGLNLDNSGRRALLTPYRDGNAGMVAELEELWTHQPNDQVLLDALPSLARSFWRVLGGDEPPRSIGAYEVLEELGRGGMGVVYKARQPPPLSRLVAIKVLPSALSSNSWRHRFEIEQKSLSLMCHPNITTVHDAGVTEEGQPFLVMELLDGLPITRYCDVHRLSVDTRLDLFLQICEGVNHAHRKGIIHRDLKPSNVMVVEQDGRHVPKVIDFGIAGSLDVTESMRPGRVVGTPALMSPEQAAGRGGEIDTRTDVYSLGALLFELLVGKSPLGSQLGEAQGLEAKLRIVCQQEPASLAQQAADLVSIEMAALRSASPARLIHRLEGELDWITAKALARKPRDRYGSCSELAADLRRLRENRPVSAAPAGAWYPMKKWLANHRLLVSGGLMILTALVLALVVSLVSLRSVRTSERRLRIVREFTESLPRQASPYYMGRDVKLVDVLHEAARDIEAKYTGEPELERSLRLILAHSFQDLGLYEVAETHFARSHKLALSLGRNDDPETLSAVEERAFNISQLGDNDRALSLYKEGMVLAKRRLGEKHPASLRLSSGYAHVLGQSDRSDEARLLFEKTLAGQRVVRGPDHPETLATINNLGSLLVETYRYAEAERLLVGPLAAYRSQRNTIDPFAGELMHNLAFAYLGQKRYTEAIDIGEEAWEARKTHLGQFHPKSLMTTNLLATAIGEYESAQRAVAMLDQALQGLPNGAENTPEGLRLKHNLGHFLLEARDLPRAEMVLAETWHQRRELLGVDHIDTLKTHVTLGEVKMAQGQHEAGKQIYEEVVDLAGKRLPPDDPLYQLFYNLWRAARGDVD